MAFRRPLTIFNLPSPLRTTTCLQCRQLHRLSAPPVRIPKPTPFVPDAQTFLTLIGRGMSQHAAKIPSWEALFTLSSQQLKDSGVEPARARRYLLWWRERYRNGITGVGADLQNVQDGVAELRVVEVPSKRPRDTKATISSDAGTRKTVVNTPATVAHLSSEEAGLKAPIGLMAPIMKVAARAVRPVEGIKILGSHYISGTGVEHVKGHLGVARLKVKDGLWEERRGVKVDGGERRRAEVRAKRRAAQRQNAR